MDLREAWDKIITALEGKSIELPTVPKTNKVPVWFTASTDGNDVYINKAKINEPSSSLTATRKLKYKTFEKVYPLYLRRERGESVSKEVTHATVDQVYYFSVIKHFVI